MLKPLVLRAKRALEGREGGDAAKAAPTAPKDDTYSSFDEARIKHLEMIQDVVARLGNDGFIVKGWCLTVAGVLFGYAFTSRNALVPIVGFGTTVMFWRLDAYFLRCERLFRCLYDRVRTRDASVEPFFMGATRRSFANETKSQVGRAVYSRTLISFYLPIALVPVLVILLIAGPAPSSMQSAEATPTTSAIAPSMTASADVGPISSR